LFWRIKLEITSLEQNITYLAINLIYAVVCLFVSILALIVIDKFVFKNIDFMEEIRKGNIAVAIFQSVILLFIGVVVSLAMT